MVGAARERREDVIISEASPGELSQESFAPLPSPTLLSNNRAASFAHCWKADFSFVSRSSPFLSRILFWDNRAAPIIVGAVFRDFGIKLSLDTDFKLHLKYSQHFKILTNFIVLFRSHL